MKMEIGFPGGVAVDATFKGHTIHTDQPETAGGEDSGPTPFDLFLASIGSCSGFYALTFCQQRGISTKNLRVVLETVQDQERHRIATVRVVLQLPEDFPEKYRQAILRSADQCTVKRHILEPPEFEIMTDVRDSVEGGSR